MRIALVVVGMAILVGVGIVAYHFPQQSVYQAAVNAAPKNGPAEPLIAHITKTNPVDGAGDIPLNSKITIIFDHELAPNNYTFSINPPNEYDESISNNTLTISPKIAWKQGTLYTFEIAQAKPHIFSRSYSFKTLGHRTLLPNTASADGPKLDADYNRTNHPDIFLVNMLPHAETTFTIVSGYESRSGTDHYFFTVTVKGDPQEAKKEVALWLYSLGLSQAQQDSLDLRYSK